MRQRYQVAVIGAGPAGAAAAYYLSKAGLQVLVMEKQQFPRAKLCGGGVTTKVSRELEFSFDGVIEKTVRRVVISENYQWPITIERERPMVFMVTRDKFDQLLLDKAREQGAGIHFSKVVSIAPENDKYNLTLQDGNAVRADYVIGADGALGVSFKHVNNPQDREIAVALEATVPDFHCIEEAKIDYGIVPAGYGWAFPKGDHLSVGVGTFAAYASNLKAVFQDYVSNQPLLQGVPDIKPKGFIIPFCHKRTSFLRGKVLLAGDAAGLADPFSGEGIYNAIRSGRIAAEVIIAAENTGASLETYVRRLQKEVLPELRRAYLLSKLFYPRSAFFHKMLRCRRKMALILLETIFGDYSYKSLSWRTLKHLFGN